MKDVEAFRQWVESETPFERIEDLLPRFEAHYGKAISYRGLHKWLQRIGWSHKKNVAQYAFQGLVFPGIANVMDSGKVSHFR
ncbi:hypothetical protein [Thiothrix nivea]|uniref:hypothetical protein n=1 Tax=Thiothrix nivea TaxID=1031 RepID=UPI0002E90B5A|nr:hypothetical protein [Thiothrix nivea]